MLQDIIDLCLNELNKKENKEKMENKIMEPLISHILTKLRPFFIGAMVFLVLTISIMICILFIVIFK